MAYLPVAVALSLAREYDRRSAQCTFTCRFPRSATAHQIPDYLARLMLEDAYHQGYQRQHHAPIQRAYQALAAQIERRAEALGPLDRMDWRRWSACCQLRFVVAQWARSSFQ